MASFFTLLLLVSVGGVVLLLTLKQIEVATGTVLFSIVRPKVNRFFKTCLLIVERGIPGLVKEGFNLVWQKIKTGIQWFLAHGLLKFETWLKSMLALIREKTHPSHARGEASPFLREVGEYKKQLESESKEESPDVQKVL
jgi:hypothetical protein